MEGEPGKGAKLRGNAAERKEDATQLGRRSSIGKAVK